MLPSAELIAELAVSLPVSRHRAEILEHLARSPVIVVESPTGSGKTTQLPRILYEAGYGRDRRIGVTQPRRIAAVSVSEFIRAQLQATQDAEAGADPDLVAYKMRFEDTTGERTRIKIMTDGVLLQELKHDRLLREYAVLMIDEAHERSLNIDFVLGLLKGVLAQRPEFKVIVSSATINAEVFSEYFDECPIVRIDTPQHPVQIHYRPFQPAGDPEQLQAAIERLVLEIHRARRRGDVLIFLSGERDIRACIARLAARPESRRWQLLPLFARLSQAEQGLVFEPFPERRKIVVATNIAETSITIPGIGFVIDSGLAKINSYNTRTLTAALTEQPISHASCNQRRGRAGRTGPGACYRLYSEQSYRQRPLFQLEEIPPHRPVGGGAAHGRSRDYRVRGVRLSLAAGAGTDRQWRPVVGAAGRARPRTGADRHRPPDGAVSDPAAPRAHAGRGASPLPRRDRGDPDRRGVSLGTQPAGAAGGTRAGGAPRPSPVPPPARRSGGLSAPVPGLPG